MFNGSPLDKRPLWYSNPVGEKTPVVDEWGNETGETSQTWSAPAKLMLNVSPPTGSAEASPFGAFTDYSYIVSTPRKKRRNWFLIGYSKLASRDILGSSSKLNNNSLCEGSHVWFGVKPDAPYNYIVVKVAEHITDTLYALKEVAASEN